MRNALCFAGYFAIATGIIIAVYIITSLKIVDISAIDFVAEESPHPYRWLYASFVLAVTVPIGLMAVTVSHFLERKSSDYTYHAKERPNESYHNRPFY
ncbi:hypothetical protein [Neobacillus drentensis]|uniref:hypothetical protein n=1 Tax=Neobacillus drentensis TaxID=220684 RepID=UPI002FFE3673